MAKAAQKFSFGEKRDLIAETIRLIAEEEIIKRSSISLVVSVECLRNQVANRLENTCDVVTSEVLNAIYRNEYLKKNIYIGNGIITFYSMEMRLALAICMNGERKKPQRRTAPSWSRRAKTKTRFAANSRR
ncbi:MAG TPA: hypothetical protein VF817_03000 [Patescibacteria group bacterium]